MLILEKQLDAYSCFYKAHFDKVDKEKFYKSSLFDIFSNQLCILIDFLISSREDYDIARSTRIESLQES